MTTLAYRLRPAAASDAEAICRIYNQGIEERVATFETLLERQFGRLRDVGLDDEPLGTPLSNLSQGLVGSRLILVIVNGDLGATLGQRERDPAADAT